MGHAVRLCPVDRGSYADVEGGKDEVLDCGLGGFWSAGAHSLTGGDVTAGGVDTVVVGVVGVDGEAARAKAAQRDALPRRRGHAIGDADEAVGAAAKGILALPVVDMHELGHHDARVQGQDNIYVSSPLAVSLAQPD